MTDISYVKIFNCRISNINSDILIRLIEKTIESNNNLLITYATFHSLNLLYKNVTLQNTFSKFDIVHPDGMGVYFASFLVEGKRFSNRFTGSDFYPTLINRAVKNKWKVFFFGDCRATLNKIQAFNKGLNITNIQEGFDYNEEDLVNKINQAMPHILVVGLGCPKQELWIINNKNKIKANIIIAVGDGIKVFAGVKRRGPLFIRKAGLEWIIRLFYNPKLYWQRYILGIPVFIARIIKIKLTS